MSIDGRHAPPRNPGIREDDVGPADRPGRPRTGDSTATGAEGQDRAQRATDADDPRDAPAGSGGGVAEPEYWYG